MCSLEEGKSCVHLLQINPKIVGHQVRCTSDARLVPEEVVLRSVVDGARDDEARPCSSGPQRACSRTFTLGVPALLHGGEAHNTGGNEAWFFLRARVLLRLRHYNLL